LHLKQQKQQHRQQQQQPKAAVASLPAASASTKALQAVEAPLTAAAIIAAEIPKAKARCLHLAWLYKRTAAEKMLASVTAIL
jgi:hypothetical protein